MAYKPELFERVYFYHACAWNTGVCRGHIRNKEHVVYIAPDNGSRTLIVDVNCIKQMSYWR